MSLIQQPSRGVLEPVWDEDSWPVMGWPSPTVEELTAELAAMEARLAAEQAHGHATPPEWSGSERALPAGSGCARCGGSGVLVDAPTAAADNAGGTVGDVAGAGDAGGGAVGDVAGAGDAGGGAARAAADAAGAADAGAVGGGAWRLSDADVLVELGAARRGLAVAQARWLTVVAEAERREVTQREFGVPLASWLAAGASHTARSARMEVRLAGRLAAHRPVAEALRSGEVSVEQAAVIVDGLGRLPDGLDAGQVGEVAVQLVGFAGEFNAEGLRRLVNRAVEVVAPQVAEEHDRKALERAERRQQESRHVGWRRDPEDGGVRFWGKLPAVEGELFIQHLTALAAAERAADAANGVDTTVTQAFADGLALCVAHHASCVGGPVKGGDHTRVVVNLDHATLVAGVGAATLVESDTVLTAGAARRLACTAGILPVVFDGDSVALDLGRSRRLFSPPQRLVLALRDGGCAFPGCDRPPADCDTHHARQPWSQGGRTDVADGVLVCPHHHHVVEPDPSKPPEQNWQIHLDARGKPVFASPVGRDGTRTWRQHHRYQT